jgi:hypothetical protein
MAKDKQAGKGHGKQNGAGGSIKGPQCAKDGANDRKTSRAEEERLERARLAEIEAGTYYIRLNAGRSTDIASACRGELGDYAHPGGNEPSLHFNVQKDINPKGPRSVVRFETVQRGHELEGQVFNSGTFVPTFYIEKFGADFRSQSANSVVAAAQELICHYLAHKLNFGITAEETAPTTFPETIEEMLARVGTDKVAMQAMLAGVPGLYGCKTARGILILEVFVGKRPNIKVVDSTIPDIQVSRAFLPVHLLPQKPLNQVTDDWTYTQQFVLYTFLQNELADLFNKPALVKEEGREMGAKERMKAERKRADKLADANERAADATALANMMKAAVSITAAASGKHGYVDLSGNEGELLVLFGEIGADKVVQVVHLHQNHMLRIAGVQEGTKVYVGQIQRGSIDKVDAAYMSPEDKRTREALIKFIVNKMEEAGIKLASPGKKLSLHLVKRAA